MRVDPGRRGVGMGEELRALVNWAAAEAGVGMQGREMNQACGFLSQFLEARDRLGLMAPVSAEELVGKHMMDCIIGLRALAPKSGARVVDVGAGGGFPGVIVAIMREDLPVTLLEARRKKARFLEEVAKDFGGRVRVVCQRAEDAGRSELRAGFDYAVVRALGKTAAVLEICLPLVKMGGALALWKGPRPSEDLLEAGKALELLGGRVSRVEEYVLPGDYGPRTLVVVGKVSPTDTKYPRKAGIPEKRPLTGGSKEGLAKDPREILEG